AGGGCVRVAAGGPAAEGKGVTPADERAAQADASAAAAVRGGAQVARRGTRPAEARGRAGPGTGGRGQDHRDNSTARFGCRGVGGESSGARCGEAGGGGGEGRGGGEAG